MASVLDKYTSQFKNGKYVGKTTGADAVKAGNTVAVPSASQSYAPTKPKVEPPKDKGGNSGGGNSGGSSPYNAPVNYTADYYEDYDDYDDDRNGYRAELANIQAKYDALLKAQQEAIEAGRQKAIGDINAQKDTTAQNYADMYKQMYINKMNSQKGIDQQLAAMGQTGGAAESTLLGLQTNYADALRQGKLGEQNAQSALDKAIVDAGLAASVENANAIANTGFQSANSYQTALQNLINLEAQENQNRIAMANERANTNRQYAYNIAMSILGNGQMPDDSTLASAGINKNDALAIVAGNQKATGLGTKPASKDNTQQDTSGLGVMNDTAAMINYYQQTGNKNELDKIKGDLISDYSTGKISIGVYKSLMDKINGGHH